MGNPLDWANWQILTASLFGTVVVGYGLALHKAFMDRKTAQCQIVSNYHLKRRESLSKCITLIQEFRHKANEIDGIYSSIASFKSAIPEADIIDDEYIGYVGVDNPAKLKLIGELVRRKNDYENQIKELKGEGKLIWLNATNEAEQYGDLPYYLTGFREFRLATYISRIGNSRIHDLLDIQDRFWPDLRDIHRHVNALLFDLRELSDIELRAAQDALLVRRERVVYGHKIPYLRVLATFYAKYQPKMYDLNFSALEPGDPEEEIIDQLMKQ